MGRVTSKGQVTIPIELREALGITAGTVVEFERAGDSMLVRKAGDGGRRERIRDWIERVAGSGDVGMTTDEIMALTRGDD